MIYGMGTIVPRLLNYLLLTPFYTRIFLKGEYGVITELYAYVAFLMVLLTYGMETAYFRYAEKEEDPEKVYSTSLFSVFSTTLLFLLIIGVFAQPIATLIRYPSNKEYIVYFAFIVAIDAITAIPFARLRKQMKALRFALIRITSVLVNIALNMFFFLVCPAILNHHPESVVRLIYSPEIGVGYAFISNLIGSAVTMLMLFPEIFRIRIRIDFALLRRMLAYALPLLVVGLAGMVNEVSDKILLKYLVYVPPDVTDPENYAMEQVGIYGANFKMAVLLTIFIQMFRYAAEPFFFAEAKKENPQKVYADVMKYFVIFCLLIFLAVTLYMDVFQYFIGKEFRSGLHIVPIILLANLFLGIFYNQSVWYKLTNLTRYGAYIAVMGALVTVAANVILVPEIGYKGSAWGHFACYLSMIVVSHFLGQKFYPIPYPYKQMALYFLLALGLFLISLLFPVEPVLTKVLVHTGYMLIFIAVVVVREKSGLLKQFK
jgi:O-antigen/teichoic acid export membrane protein